MTEVDYTGYSDASRASIQMSHSAFGPTLSYEEAQKLEQATAEHLLKSRKLSLIVDLDQTIVHATVDPTVGDWITEGLSWESKPNNEEPCNPNWEALKDVKSFKLTTETSAHMRGRMKQPESEGCMYYIKPRPGWENFFDEVSKKYEMHVYTMGTRAYAEQVCAAIDPEGKYFGGRILSRDESGSLTQKSLRRLFPCDTSMVVIIDDRADVWEWSPNLIKVIPFDFFVGIGDINSAFLPRVSSLGSTPKPPPPKPVPENPTSPTPEEAERVQQEKSSMIAQNSRALLAQVDERPLAKKQEKLDDEEEEKSAPEPQAVESDNESTHSSKHGKHGHKALLKNDDTELQRVGKLLDDVHATFYKDYDDYKQKRHHKGRSAPHDVTKIIPKIRKETLQGVNIVFSSVIPLDTRPETTEIWNTALMFGAQCFTDLSPSITHLVAAKRGTMKVDAARKKPQVQVVWLNWFTDSIALWRRQDERPYLLDDPPTPNQTRMTGMTRVTNQGTST